MSYSSADGKRHPSRGFRYRFFAFDTFAREMEMVSLEQILRELEAIPESKWLAHHYEQCVGSWSTWVTTNDPNKLGMMLNSERELVGNVQACLCATLGLQAGPYADQPALARSHALWTLAKLLAVREYIHRFRFFAALVSPTFGKLTNGHRVNPDAYHVYRSDPTSPTGVVLEINGPKTAEYAALVAAAGRSAGTSNSFA